MSEFIKNYLMIWFSDERYLRFAESAVSLDSKPVKQSLYSCNWLPNDRQIRGENNLLNEFFRCCLMISYYVWLSIKLQRVVVWAQVRTHRTHWALLTNQMFYYTWKYSQNNDSIINMNEVFVFIDREFYFYLLFVFPNKTYPRIEWKTNFFINK